MANRNRCITLLSLSLVFLLAEISTVLVEAVGRPGGWTPIENPNDPTVVEIAKFAVTQHNKDANTLLKFSRIVKGESQVVAGTNYKLVIAAKDGKSVNNYEAVVWDKPWQNFRQLTSFKPIA